MNDIFAYDGSTRKPRHLGLYFPMLGIEKSLILPCSR
jgi:hypothetical protein